MGIMVKDLLAAPASTATHFTPHATTSQSHATLSTAQSIALATISQPHTARTTAHSTAHSTISQPHATLTTALATTSQPHITITTASLTLTPPLSRTPPSTPPTAPRSPLPERRRAC